MFSLITITLPFILFIIASDFIVLGLCIYNTVAEKSREERENEDEDCP